MSKTNIVRYEFVKNSYFYLDIINNYKYVVVNTNKEKFIVYISPSNEVNFSGNYLDNFSEIYLDQFIEFYNESTGKNINKIEKLVLKVFQKYNEISQFVPINLDYIKIDINKLFICDNGFVITSFEKHFKTIKMFFGADSTVGNMEMGNFRSIFIKNIVNIKNNNYDKLVIEHSLGQDKSHYYYCSADHNLCKIRDQLNLKNVVIKNINNEIEFSDEDFVDYCKSYENYERFFELN